MLEYPTIFSDAQTTTGSVAAQTQSSNVYKLGDGLADAWGSELMPQFGGLVWNLNVATTFVASSNTGYIRADLMVHSAAASIKSGTVVASINIGAEAVAGTRYAYKFPPGYTIPGSAINTPHMATIYTVVTKKVSAGAMDSWLSLDMEKVD